MYTADLGIVTRRSDLEHGCLCHGARRSAVPPVRRTSVTAPNIDSVRGPQYEHFEWSAAERKSKDVRNEVLDVDTTYHEVQAAKWVDSLISNDDATHEQPCAFVSVYSCVRSGEADERLSPRNGQETTRSRGRGARPSGPSPHAQHAASPPPQTPVSPPGLPGSVVSADPDFETALLDPPQHVMNPCGPCGSVLLALSLAQTVAYER